jgi:hypothetical protein
LKRQLLVESRQRGALFAHAFLWAAILTLRKMLYNALRDSQKSIKSIRHSIVLNLPRRNCEKKADGVYRKWASAKAPEEIVVLDLETAELWRQLQKISDAVHTGNPAPHLRLVPDAE